MTTVSPILKISDGTTEISLLDPIGILLSEWIPTLPEPKGGGVWADSPIAEGRKLAYRQLGNIVDTFDLKVRGGSQDDAIRKLQELRRLLESAIEYWTSDAQNNPVYLIAKAAYETNTRYAVILDYRTPRDSNPFAQPFFSCKHLVDNFLLSIEHGLWQDNVPGNSECVEVSAVQSYAGTAVLSSYRPTASADDCYIDIGSIYTAAVVINLGKAAIGDFEGGVRFTNVTVPNGSTIQNAWVEFVTALSGAQTGLCILRIRGEDVDDSVAFTTRVDFVGRTRTTAYADWNVPETSGAGELLTSADIANVIQEIVDRVGWVSGNDLTLFFPRQDGYYDRDAASWDNTTYSEPVLYIEYVPGTLNSFGRSATCDANEVFIANKHNRANLTNIYHYDDSGAAWSGNLVGAATPFAFLPAVPAVDDIVYFGCDTTVGDSGPFNNLVFDISTAQVDLTTIVWEYYNGAWVTLTVQDNTATTDPFDRTGVRSVHWTQPSNWTTVAINGVTAYWVRARVTVVGASPTPPYQDNRDIYSCVWPYIDIAEGQVEGDIPALARIRLTNQSDASGGTPDLRANRFIVGARSLSRGDSFSAYMNVSDEQNPTGITVALGANTVYSNNSSTPTGRLATYTSPALAGTTTEATFTIDSTIAPDYRGRFRAFIRYAYPIGAVDAVSLRLITTPGGSGLTQYSDYYYPQNNSYWQLADMGIVSIPYRAIADQYGTITFAIEITRDTNGRVIYLHELILMPVDEWATDAVDKSGLAVRTGAVGYDDILDIDSVTYPRQTDQAVMRTASTGRIIGYYQNRQIGAALLQANAAQRLWFLCISYESGTELSSLISVSHTIQVQRVQRYLSARGTR